MKIKIKKIVNRIFSAIIILFLFNSAVLAGDSTESWNTLTLKHKINERFTYILYGLEIMGDNVSEHEYWELRTGVSYKASDHWSFAVYYLHGEFKNAANKWIDENRAETDAVYKWSWGNFKWSDRLRVAYKIVNGKEKFQYRNKIKVAKPIMIFSQKLTVFVDEELFYNDDVDRYNENRFSVGFSKKINDHITTALYYRYRAIKGVNDWSGANIIGTFVSITL